MRYLLGIDAGGTKTHIVLADENGAVVAKAAAGRANLHTVPAPEIISHLRAGFRHVMKQAGAASRWHINACVAGFAGLDSAADERKALAVVKRAFGSALNEARLKVVNDISIGFRSGSSSGVGVCVIGGTGSNAYGRNRRGKEARAGGLGHILSDEGSGYAIGLRALSAAAQSADGRGPKTKLLPLILKRYKVKTIRDLVPVVYAPGYGKHDIGQLALDVQAAAQAGDAVAKSISKEAGAALASLAIAVSQKLFAPEEPFDVVMIGGVLQHDRLLSAEFKKQVRSSFPKAKFVVPKVDPVMGAILMAMDL